MASKERCLWCGREINHDDVVWSIGVHPLTHRDAVLTACSQEHMDALRRGKDTSTAPTRDGD